MPHPITIITKQLNALADYREQQTQLDIERQILVDTVLTPEIKEAIASIEAEFAGRDEVIAGRIAKMEEVIKRTALAENLSVRGNALQVIVVQRSDQWNGKGLSEYARDHPAIDKFSNPGARYAQIRASHY